MSTSTRSFSGSRNNAPFARRFGLHGSDGAFDGHGYHQIAQRSRRDLSVTVDFVVEPHVCLRRLALPVSNHVQRRRSRSAARLHLILRQASSLINVTLTLIRLLLLCYHLDFGLIHSFAFLNINEALDTRTDPSIPLCIYFQVIQ